MDTVLGKHQIEKALYEEKNAISAGRLKDDNPLDVSIDFRQLCEASRKGDLKVCQEQITKGVNINARDEYDYTPLILASLCGHYEVVQMLLEQGALCERDTFQGERCLYNALNDRIRNLLLSYDYSKSTDPLQPLAAHVTGLLTRDAVKTSDIAVCTEHEQFDLHKFVLSARSPYFAKKLLAAPDTKVWKLPSSVPSESFRVCIRYLYMGDVSADLGDGEEEQAILLGIDKMSRQLEIPQLFENILLSDDRRLARQRRTEEIARARDQLHTWFRKNVLANKMEVCREKAMEVKWDRENGIFADILLRVDVEEESHSNELQNGTAEYDHNGASKETDKSQADDENDGVSVGIPIGSFVDSTVQSQTQRSKPERALLFPCHRAMLLRSELFATMLASPFREGQETQHLQIVPVDCSPEVLEVVLTFLYTEQADFPLSIALEVLEAADMLFIEKLKQRAALLISTLGNGSASVLEREHSNGESEPEDAINIYDVIRAGWTTRVHRLEEFAARFIAYRLEEFIDEQDFKDLVRESAGRIQSRQETDTIELIDDIRYYLSERFRLRFEDAGLDEMMDDTKEDKNGHDEIELNKESDVDSDAVILPPQSVLTEPKMVVRTLDGELVGDEFVQDAQNYQILLAKIDTMMENLGLDA